MLPLTLIGENCFELLDILETKSEQWPILGAGRGHGKKDPAFFHLPVQWSSGSPWVILDHAHPNLWIQVRGGQNWQHKGRKDAAKPAKVSSWASGGFQAPSQHLWPPSFPESLPRARDLAHLRFPNADNPGLDPTLPLLVSNILLSCSYFLSTCLLLTGSFPKSYTFISRCSVSLSPKPSLAWRRDVEPMSLAPESGGL